MAMTDRVMDDAPPVRSSELLYGMAATTPKPTCYSSQRLTLTVLLGNEATDDARTLQYSATQRRIAATFAAEDTVRRGLLTATFGAGALNRPRAGTLFLSKRSCVAHRPLR
ncbi:MAG: hypothetical protein KIT37_03750 [Steroidobacteraceae bacterium]|nr:hypothetical protein [Steroidobacteraceae bacterium]